MHLVTRISINAIQPMVVGSPEEEKRDTIHDHCSTSQQCAPDDTSAKSFELRHRESPPVLRRSACPGLVSAHTDLQDHDDDGAERHACCERATPQRCDSLAG